MYLDIHKEAEVNMGKTISAYKEELQSIRAGRANPALLDKIMVESYGQMTPLKQIGSISAPEARLITIQPWDANLISEIVGFPTISPLHDKYKIFPFRIQAKYSQI